MVAVRWHKKGKKVSASALENQKIKLFSKDMSPDGIFFGGRLLQTVDGFARVVANNHAEMNCKPLGIDFVRFFSPVKMGDILTCSASVNRTWESIMEVGVKVVAEDFRLLEKKKILSAYFTYSVQEDVGVAFIIPETKEDEKRYFAAEKRRQYRNKY